MMDLGKRLDPRRLIFSCLRMCAGSGYIHRLIAPTSKLASCSATFEGTSLRLGASWLSSAELYFHCPHDSASWCAQSHHTPALQRHPLPSKPCRDSGLERDRRYLNGRRVLPAPILRILSGKGSLLGLL